MLVLLQRHGDAEEFRLAGRILAQAEPGQLGIVAHGVIFPVVARTGLLAFQRGPDVHFTDKGHAAGLMQLEQVMGIRRRHARQIFFPDALQFLERGLQAAFVLEDGDPVGEDRFLDGGQHFFGRETFLARVEWENDWPVVNPGVGRLTDTVEINLPKWTTYTAESNEYVFSTMGQLPPEFMVLRNADKSHYSLEKGKGLLMLFDTHTLKEQASPSYLAFRQKHHHFIAKALLDVSNLSEDKRAGIAYVQNNLYNLRVEVNGKMAEVILCEKGTDRRVISMPLQGSNPLEVSLEVDGLSAAVIIEGQKSPEVDIRTLSTEAAGGFTGCTVGLYAVADTENTDCACFKRFSYSEAL